VLGASRETAPKTAGNLRTEGEELNKKQEEDGRRLRGRQKTQSKKREAGCSQALKELISFGIKTCVVETL